MKTFYRKIPHSYSASRKTNGKVKQTTETSILAEGVE